MIRQRRKYLSRLDYLEQNQKSAIIIQSYVRMWIQRRKFVEKKNIITRM